MEKLIGQFVPLLEPVRGALRILLFTGQPSRGLEAVAGHDGWQTWLGLHVLAFVPWTIILKSVHIDWLDINFLLPFALLNVVVLCLWLIIFNLLLGDIPVTVDDLLLMTSVYYGPIFFWSSVLGLLLGPDYFGEQIRLAGLFKEGEISLLDFTLPSDVPLAAVIKADIFSIVWLVAYLLCSAGLSIRMVEAYKAGSGRVYFVVSLTSLLWIVTIVVATPFLLVPFYSLFVGEL